MLHTCKDFCQNKINVWWQIRIYIYINIYYHAKEIDSVYDTYCLFYLNFSFFICNRETLPSKIYIGLNIMWGVCVYVGLL